MDALESPVQCEAVVAVEQASVSSVGGKEHAAIGIGPDRAPEMRGLGFSSLQMDKR